MGLREDNVGTLQDAASKRKARLLELKNRKRKKGADDEDRETPEAAAAAEDDDLPTSQVLFRNYRPSSTALTEGVLEATAPTDVDSMVENQISLANEHATAMQQVELSSLAPKKITFDLKRCIEDKLEKLERATDRSIAELIRARLKEEAARQQTDLLAAVNAGAMAGDAASREDEDD